MEDKFQKLINDFEKQLKENLPFFYKEKSIKKFSSLVIFGMGGSGVVGDFLKQTARFLKIYTPIEIIKDSKIKEDFYYDKKSLFIGISFSGNTKETISLSEEIIKKGFQNRLAFVTQGGVMEKIARSKKIPLIKISPLSLTPREGIGLMYNGVLRILGKKAPPFKIRNKEEIIKYGKRLASKIKGNIVIYTPSEFKHLGILWKNNFNETSKNIAFYGIYPEINHNEIEGLENISGNFNFLFLEENLFPYNEKLNFVKKILRQKNCSFHSVKIEGKNIWEKTWNGTFLSYITSYYLALKNKKDPFDTKIISKLKALDKN